MESCRLSRRGLLDVVLLGAVGLALRPSISGAADLASGHRPRIATPNLAEDPIAVPVRVSVEHPMEPGHFIESLDIVLATDPVPRKGTFRFTPANGRAEVAFPMRSGVGGLLEVTATCSRHGRFVGTRELRVAGDGCAVDLETPAKNRARHPKLRVTDTPWGRGVVEVLARLDHESDTGLRSIGGKYVRVRPEFFLRQMRVYLGRRMVSDFRFTSALSPSPIIRFPLKITGEQRLRVVFLNSEGRQWEATQLIRPPA